MNLNIAFGINKLAVGNESDGMSANQFVPPETASTSLSEETFSSYGNLPIEFNIKTCDHSTII
jgi:hypothetical protein